MSIKRLNNLNQSIWIDFLSRSYLETGGLESHINAGVSGVTSNPTILNKAISESSIYDKDITTLVAEDKDTQDIYEEIIRRDFTVAAKLLYPKFLSSMGHDGYVSLEVDPAFAHRVEPTIYQAAYLYNLLDIPNLMIKIPATDAGIEAFRQIIFDGINVNMTLLFSVDQYRKVAEAYVEALKDREKDGRSLSDIASVASFFVSRIDTAVDNELHKRGNNLELTGKAAIASARQAYMVYCEIFHSPEFVYLRRLGARPQRLLWASTSVKNPDYSPLKYVKGLILSNTINTLPPSTLDSVIQCEDYQSADNKIYICNIQKTLQNIGIDLRVITDQLLTDGIRAFLESFDELFASLYARIRGKKYVSGDFES